MRLQDLNASKTPSNDNDYFLVYSTFIKKVTEGEGKDVEVLIAEREVSREFAFRMQRLWVRLLMTTRYPKESYVGVDGSMYVFGAWATGLGGMRGEIWDPETGIMKEMVEIMREMELLCKGDGGGEGAMIERMNAIEDRLTSASGGR